MLIVCPACASEYAIEPGRLGPEGRRVRCAQCRESWHATAPEAIETAPDTEAELAAAPVPAPTPMPTATVEAVADEDQAATALPVAEMPPTSEPETPLPAEASTPGPDPAGAPEEGDAPDAPVTIESRDHAVAPSRAKSQTKGRPAKAAKAAKPRYAGSATRSRPGRFATIGAALAAGLACAAVLAGRNVLVSAVPEAAVVFERLGLPVNVVGLTFADVVSSMTLPAPGGGPPSVLMVEGRIENPTRREIEVPEIDVAVRGEAGELLYNWSVPAATQKLAGGEGTTFRARLSSPPPAGQRVQVTFRMEGRDVKVALR